MDHLLSKYGWLVISVIVTVIFLGAYIGLMDDDSIKNSKLFSFISHSEVYSADTDYDVPDVLDNDFIVSSAILEVGDSFEWKDYVSINSTNNLDLLDYVTVEGYVDTSTVGEYDIVYSLTWNGRTIIKTAKYYVTYELTDLMYLIQYDTYFEQDGVLIEGEMPEEAATLYYESDGYIGLTSPVAPGLDFIGWYDNPEFEGDMITGIEADETGDKKFYAYYSLIRYSISYETDGGILPDDSVYFYFYTDRSFALPIPEKEGYTFVGWYDNEDLSGEMISSHASGSEGDITYYAKWTKD